MAISVTSKTNIGSCYRFSGVVTDAQIKAAFAAILQNGVYVLNRHIYLDADCNLTQQRLALTVRTNGFTFFENDLVPQSDKITWSGLTLIVDQMRITATRFELYRRYTDATSAVSITPKFGLCMEKNSSLTYADGTANRNELPNLGSFDNSAVQVTEILSSDSRVEPRTGYFDYRGVPFNKIGRLIVNGDLGLNSRFYRCSFFSDGGNLGTLAIQTNAGALFNNSAFELSPGTDMMINNYQSSLAASLVILGNHTSSWAFGPTGLSPIAFNQPNDLSLFGGIRLKKNFVGSGPDGRLFVYDSRNGDYAPAENISIDISTPYLLSQGVTELTGGANGEFDFVLLATVGSRVSGLSSVTGNKFQHKLFGKRNYIEAVNALASNSDDDTSPYSPILLTDEPFITVNDEATIRSYTSIANLDEMGEAIHILAIDTNDASLDFDTNIQRLVGSTIDLGSVDVVIDPTMGSAYGIDVAGNTLGIRSSGIQSGSIADGLKTTGNVTFAANSAGSFKTIVANEVSGDLDGVDVDGTWRTQLPVTLAGRTVTKLLIDGGVGDISLTNCNVGEIENQSGSDASVFLTGTTAPVLTETNGALNVATPITFTDIAGDPFTFYVIDPSDNSVVRAYDPTPLTSYNVDAGARSQLRIAAYKPGYYTSVRTFDISGSATFQIIFEQIPFLDMIENIDAIKNDITTEIIMAPYAGVGALARGTFASPWNQLSQNQFKRVFSDFQGRQDLMELLALFNYSGSGIFNTTPSGVDILQPVIQFAVAGDFEVSTLAYINNIADDTLPPYEWNPENPSNRKVVGAPVPILLQSNIGLDGGGGLTLAEIESSTVLAKESSVLARPTLAEMEASEALTAVADVSGLATQASVDDLGSPLQATDYIAPPTLAEIEASTILAKQATVVEIKSRTDNLPNDPAGVTDLPVISGLATSAQAVTINEGVRRASLGIPHGDSL